MNLKWQGTFYINDVEVKNRIMDTVIDQLIETLINNSVDLEIKYLAIGTGTTAISDTDTTLDNEIFRTPYTTRTKTATGEVTTDFIILDSEAVATWEEIGIFGGSTATATADTGTLISRILYNKVKTASEEITIRRVDRLSRG